jgi:hypothetical protein
LEGGSVDGGAPEGRFLLASVSYRHSVREKKESRILGGYFREICLVNLFDAVSSCGGCRLLLFGMSLGQELRKHLLEDLSFSFSFRRGKLEDGSSLAQFRFEKKQNTHI